MVTNHWEGCYKTGAGASEVFYKKGGGAENVKAMLKGEGSQQVLR